MPIVFMTLALIGLLVFIRNDAPKFYLLTRQKDDQARKAILSMYITKGSEEVTDRIITMIKK